MPDIVHQPQPTIDHDTLERVLLTGDLARLSPQQRIDYYQAVCKSVGLNPLTQPFAYIPLNGKTVLYATRAATDQLRQIHRVSVIITSRETKDGVHTVTARATLPSGRTDESVGSVWIAGLKGEALANAIMKADTKSRRRVTLAICGLSLLDETEVETIPGTNPIPPDVMHAPQLPANVVRLQPAEPPEGGHRPGAEGECAERADRAAEGPLEGGAIVEMFGQKLSACANEDALVRWCLEVRKLAPKHTVRVVLFGMLRQHARRLGLDVHEVSRIANDKAEKGVSK